MITRFADNIILLFINLMIILTLAGQPVSAILIAGILMTIIIVIGIELTRKNTVAIIATVFSVFMIMIDIRFSVLAVAVIYELISMTECSVYLKNLLTQFEQKKINGDKAAVKSKSAYPYNTLINGMLAIGLTIFHIYMTHHVYGINGGIVNLGICLLSVFMAIKSSYYQNEISYYQDKFDEARYEKKRAVRKNEKAIQEAEENIYMATLKERNRIAREIHDNVGHMLTRAIVQLEAVKIINKDDNTKPYLESVSDTVNQAMLNIRRSVHELHDDSIDMSIMINEIVKEVPDNFEVDCKTSIESATSAELKNTILAIIKESINNIIKYSKGDKVKVEVIEHASFWRVYISDNGVNQKIDYSAMYREGGRDSGIGLENIFERAKKMGGRASITSDEKGFVVLVTIPKMI